MNRYLVRAGPTKMVPLRQSVMACLLQVSSPAEYGRLDTTGAPGSRCAPRAQQGGLRIHLDAGDGVHLN